MYSPAVGACAPAFSAAINHQSVQKLFGFDLRCIQPSAMASQYTFIVTTKPATKANQLRSEITFGATSSNATVKTILTNSQMNKPAKAEPGWVRRICRLKALTNTTAGITTATVPQADDAASRNSPVTQPVISAKNTPTPACKNKTCHGDDIGLFCRQVWACSAVRGLNSGSRPSSAASGSWSVVPVFRGEAILVISNDTEVTYTAIAAKPTIIRRNPCVLGFFA